MRIEFYRVTKDAVERTHEFWAKKGSHLVQIPFKSEYDNIRARLGKLDFANNSKQDAEWYRFVLLSTDGSNFEPPMPMIISSFKNKDRGENTDWFIEIENKFSDIVAPCFSKRYNVELGNVKYESALGLWKTSLSRR